MNRSSALNAVLRSTILWILIMTGGGTAQAQFGEDTNPFAMGVTSPTAASIGEAALSDIALETGAIQVNIPLFEITGRSGLSVPVTLSYQSNGIKVDDAGSWVGYGWTLHAGGAVTRTVRGLPDEQDVVDCPNVGMAGGGYPLVRHRLEQWTEITNARAHEISKCSLDTQPDLFTYSNPDHSGSFIWYDVNTFRTVPHVPIEIDGHPDYGWTLSDANGMTTSMTRSNIRRISRGRQS